MTTSARHGERRLLLLVVPALLVVLALFVLPIGRLVWTSLSTSDGLSFGLYGRALSDEVFGTVVWRTVKLALCVAAVTVVLGYPIAYTAVRLPKAWGAVLVAATCLPFFTSALVRTYAWRSILANNGLVNELLLSLGIVDTPVKLVFNDIGVVIGMSQVLLPMMVFPLYGAFRGIDPALTKAARSMGSNPLRAWRTVFLPLSMPGVTAGFTIVFISALGYYITPVLLQGPSTPLFAQSIDSQVNLPGQQGYVAAQAVVVLVLALAVMTVFRKRLGLVVDPGDVVRAAPGRFSSAVSTARAALGRGVEPLAGALRPVLTAASAVVSPVRWIVVAVLTGIGLLLALTPLAVVVLLGFSDDSYLRFPPSGYSTRWFESYFDNDEWLAATGLSVEVSVLAAVVATLLAGLATFALARTRRRRLAVPAHLLLVAPMIVPQVIVAVSLLFTLLPVGVAGTRLGLVAGYVVLGMPLAVIVLNTAFRGLDPQYERASASLGAGPGETARRVIVPLVLPSVLAALLFVFVTAFSDLVIAQFLGGAGVATLERQMYRSIREEVSPEVAAVGTLLLAAVLLLGLAVLLARRQTRDALRGLLPGTRRDRRDSPTS